MEKQTAELHEELRQLKTLYDEIDKKKTTFPLASLVSALDTNPFERKTINPNYPTQDYEEYVSNLIKKKKVRIEERLGVESINM